MTAFTVGRPVTTTAPEVVVDAGLPIGAHRFRLVVVDDSGNASQAAEAVVEVARLVVSPATPLSPERTVLRTVRRPTP